MKRLICLLLISALAAGLLAGCDLIPEKPALVILGTDIDREIYSYYYDRVQGRPKDYGLSDNPDEDKIKDTSIELCRKYLALNTSFVYHNLSLSSTEKVAVSDNVNNHWIRFRNHYEKIGVSKQTLNKVFTADAYEDAIFSAIYDKGVGNAQGEKELKRAIRDARQSVLENATTDITVADLAKAKQKAGGLGIGPISTLPGCFVIATYKKLDFDKDLTDYIGLYIGKADHAAEGVDKAMSREGDPDVYADVKYRQNVRVFVYNCMPEELDSLYESLSQTFSDVAN